MNATCETCRWFRKTAPTSSPDNPIIDFNNPKAWFGTCHIYSPVQGFPTVRSFDFCGEHEAKSPKEST